MGIIINQSLKNAAISYLGIAIGFVTTIQLYPHILDADQFGLTRILIAIMTLCTQVINFGIPNSIIKFFPELSKKTETPGGLFWAFLIPPAIGLFIFVGLVLFFNEYLLSFYSLDSKLLPEYYLYIVPLVVFSVAFSLLNAFIKAQFNTVFASFLQDIVLRLLMIVELILYFFQIISFDVFLLLFTANYALEYLALLIYALKNNLLKVTPILTVFNRITRTQIRQYSFFSFFSGLTMLLIGNIDMLMVGTYNGLSQTGIYAIALYVGSVIAVPKKSITKISFPVIAEAFQKNNLESVQKVYKQTSQNQFLAGLLLYVGVIANIDNLYAMLPQEYANGGIVIIIIGLGNLIEMVTGANGQIIIASKYFRFDFYSSWVLMILAITLNMFLIPKFGLSGAAMATASSILFYNLIKVIFVWVKLNIHPFTWQLIGILITGLVILYLSSLIPNFPNIYVDILIRSISIASLYGISIWAFNLSDEVTQFIRQTWNKINRS